MHGPMSNVNPDEVENEVGNFWRNLYKLEKQFDSVPQAKKIASKVKLINWWKIQVDEFFMQDIQVKILQNRRWYITVWFQYFMVVVLTFPRKKECLVESQIWFYYHI